MALRKAPPHHVSHTEGFDSQQIEDHGVSESELGVEDGWFTLNHTKGMKSRTDFLYLLSLNFLIS